LVDTVIGVIHNGAGASLPLWDDPDWGQLELREVAYSRVGEDDPVPHPDHVSHFLKEES
jgi:hypothetical protein